MVPHCIGTSASRAPTPNPRSEMWPLFYPFGFHKPLNQVLSSRILIVILNPLILNAWN